LLDRFINAVKDSPGEDENCPWILPI